MLFGKDVAQFEAFAFFQRRQQAVVAFLYDIVDAFAIDQHEARVAQCGAGGAEHVTAIVAGFEVGGDGVQRGVDHLAGDGTLPDQVVEPCLIVAEVATQFLGQVHGRGRADRLVGLLGILGLGLVVLRLRRHLVRAVTLADQLAQFGDGLLGEVDRVGTHVGDQADGAGTQIDAFV